MFLGAQYKPKKILTFTTIFQAMTAAGINEELLFDLFKIVIAIICGGIIGFERELKDKPAGLRTNILVSTGSCLFVIFALKVADMFSEDSGRIIGPIITGIGFLGAGTIIQARGSVRGLTSAATIWVVAGVGMCSGLGLFYLALLVSFVVVFILLFLGRVEYSFSEFWKKDSDVILLTKPNPAVIQQVRRVMEGMRISHSKLKVKKEEGRFRITLTAYGGNEVMSRLATTLIRMPDIEEARVEES
jgi:putative Mg2+ transporter-C (MgtC) family protein